MVAGQWTFGDARIEIRTHNCTAVLLHTCGLFLESRTHVDEVRLKETLIALLSYNGVFFHI